jgi:hypothetical protein
MAAAFVVGCDIERPVRPKPKPGEPVFSSVPAEPFFVAWTQSLGFQTLQLNGQYPQQYRVSARFDHHVGGSQGTDTSVFTFAHQNPGRLYIHGDEPDQYECISTWDYSKTYHDFVDSILRRDPTAKFSPAGFAERGQPHPPTTCETVFSTEYAERFIYYHIFRYGVPPRVDEWRFHDFGLKWGDDGNQTYDIDAWKARVDSMATWSVNHGAPMYLGGWGFHNWFFGVTQTQRSDRIQNAMAWLKSHPTIRGAAWWSYEHFNTLNYLRNADESLTSEGETYYYGPMSVAISGNSAVPANRNCTWNASRTGGVPPITYSWWVNGVWYWSTNATTSFSYYNNGNPFTLRVDVTDKYGVVRSSSRTIGIIPTGGSC